MAKRPLICTSCGLTADAAQSQPCPSCGCSSGYGPRPKLTRIQARRRLLEALAPAGVQLKAAQLAHDHGLTGTLLRDATHSLRLQHRPLCSNGGGYWRATTPEEIVTQVLALRSRAREINQVAYALEQLLHYPVAQWEWH